MKRSQVPSSKRPAAKPATTPLRAPSTTGARRAPKSPSVPGPAGPSDAVAAVTPPEEAPFPIVGIGASAGGLEALERFLKCLPPKTGMAFIVV